MGTFSVRSALVGCLSLTAVAATACGSGTKTVSIANTPSQPALKTTATGTQSRTSPPPTTSSTAPTTRSAPQPAFTESEHHGEGREGASAAAAVLRARGFTPTDPGSYHAGQALEVLVGRRSGSGDGYGQQAFFFVNGRYIGTDTSQPSAALSVVSQGDTEVTLSYPLYRSGDALCCPGGGHAHVRFQLNNGKLVPLDPIPPVHSSSGLSRY